MTPKTLFPENLTPEEVLAIAEDAMQNLLEIEDALNGRILFRGKTDLGMIIEVITESSGEIVTFYPKLTGVGR